MEGEKDDRVHPLPPTPILIFLIKAMQNILPLPPWIDTKSLSLEWWRELSLKWKTRFDRGEGLFLIEMLTEKLEIGFLM